MLRSILVALDDTPGAQAARDHALALARRTGAKLTAAVVLDRPHTQSEHEFVPLGGAAFKARRDAKLAQIAERDAQSALAQCTEAAGDTPFEVLRLEDAPEPALQEAGATHDLVVVGRDCTLGREETEDEVAPVIEGLLQEGSRPLLVVPPGHAPRTEGPVLAAYDGTQPARDAFQLFALLGLAEGSPVRVVTVDEDEGDGVERAREGCAILARHGIVAEPAVLVGDDVEEALLAELDRMGARLLVMGAFSRGRLTRLISGSLTHRLLRDAKVPVFVHR